MFENTSLYNTILDCEIKKARRNVNVIQPKNQAQ